MDRTTRRSDAGAVTTTSNSKSRRRIGIYGWGVVAPGAANVRAFEALLDANATALRPDSRSELGSGLFAVGEPAFSFDDYAAWIAERRGEAYAVRLRKKMGDNVQYAVGATIQALQSQPGLEAAVKELDDACHVYVGSGVGDLPQSYLAERSLAKATRTWNHFWAQPERCAARRHYELEGQFEANPPPPVDPKTLPVDSEARFEALTAWEAYWATRSDRLHDYLKRYADIEKLSIQNADDESGHLSAIRARGRAHRALADEVGCPPPPWASVSPDLIWNIQNSPAAQLTMLLEVHGAAWAPIGACSTFGVALSCGKNAIEAGEAKLAFVGTTDPKPDPALVGAFYDARVMPGTGEVNSPFTSLRGTHVSGGSCVWIIGDADWCEARGLVPLAFVEATALASDAEHIITPSKSGPKRAIRHAYELAGIAPSDVAIMDLHATGTPGDLNELALVDEYIDDRTLITARKGQLGHGMANSGGWELTALAMGLSAERAFPTAIPEGELHPRITRKEQLVTTGRPIAKPADGGAVGVKIMLGIGGITACVVLRGATKPAT